MMKPFIVKTFQVGKYKETIEVIGAYRELVAAKNVAHGILWTDDAVRQSLRVLIVEISPKGKEKIVSCDWRQSPFYTYGPCL